MKNITFNADEPLIRKAREKAAKENTTLNNHFREWLESYVARKSPVSEYREIMKKTWVRIARQKIFQLQIIDPFA